MKNNLFTIIIFLFFSHVLLADEFDIKAKNIKIDKNSKVTIFENNVEVRDKFNNLFKADYVLYNKEYNFLELKGNIFSEDINGSIFKSSKASYDNNKKIFKSFGKSEFKTLEGYNIETSDIIIDNKNTVVSSNSKTVIQDNDGNKIYLENFEYFKQKNIFKSIGSIKIVDKLKNSYNFTQIYIDEKKKEIIGSDAKLYINNNDFKLNDNNKPRIFANTINVKDGQSTFTKSNFTMCNYRENDKCPPWELKANLMTHDKIKKTIYYDNAVIKLYNIPIFYFPKLSHPDPTVKRRSGFLIPSYSDTKNLGSSINLPYFWAISNDRDLTFNSKLFASEHPLFLGEYKQAFKNSNLTLDFGLTEGYKKTSDTKKSGDKSHLFANFVKNFNKSESINQNIEVNLQHVSNKKYLKLYKIDSNLADYETEVLENFINYSIANDDKNHFISLGASSYRTLANSYNDKYEYILPEMNYEKQLFNDKFGYGNFKSDLKVQNYDTNKYKKTFINNLDLELDRPFSEKVYKGKLLSKLKNINYEYDNVEGFRSDSNSELFGAIGYLASLDLYKSTDDGSEHLLTPKILFKYAPNYMRKEEGEYNLVRKNLFSLDRLQSEQNFEGGTNLTVGLDYEINDSFNQTNFSIGQIISEKKNNKNMPDTISLDKRFSNIVGNLNHKRGDNFTLNYNYSIDQNLKETNFNEVSMDYKNSNFNLNLNFLDEQKKSGDNEYIKTSIKYNKGDSGILTFSNKRNLITSSSEFYDLSYEYINDCLRAGLYYRREFYNDSELEAENSLMFKITLSSFGSVNSPSFN
jgi:LPS-assembly protein